MKPLNELRIGNLIYDYDEHTFYPIEEIKLNAQGNMCVIYRNGSFMSTEFVPTKITEEWMAKFGFKLFPWVFVLNAFRIDYNPIPLTFRYMSDNRSIELKYIHQLQNLYFALTGEELQIKKL